MGVLDLTPLGTSAYVTGKFSQGVSVTNTTPAPFNCLLLPFGGPWNYNTADTWSLDFWVNVPSLATQQILFDVGVPTISLMYLNLLTSGALQLYVATNAATAQTLSITHAIDAGTGWRNIRYVQTPTACYVYVDSTCRIQMTLSGVIYTANLPNAASYLGGFSLGNDSFTGILDEVAFFSTDLMGGSYGTLGASAYTQRSTVWAGNETGLVALYHLDGNLTNSGPGFIRISPNSVPTNATNTSIVDGGTTIPVNNAQTLTVVNYGPQNWLSSTTFSATAGTLHPAAVNTAVVPQSATMALETPSATTPITITDGANSLSATVTPVNTPFIGAVSATTLAINSSITFTAYGINTAWPLNTLPTASSMLMSFAGLLNSTTPYSSLAVSTLTSTTQKATMTLATGTRAGGIVVGESSDTATYPITLVVAQASISPSAGTVLPSSGTPLTSTVVQAGGNNNCTWVCSAGSLSGPVTQPSGVSSTTWTAPSAPGTYTVTATSVATSTIFTAVFTVAGPVSPSAPVLSPVVTSGGVDYMTVQTAPQIGTYPLGALALYVGTTPGAEGATAVQTLTSLTFPLTFSHATAPAGTRLYYTVKALDNQGTPNVSAPSNEVCSGTSALAAAGLPTTEIVTYKPIGGAYTGTSGLVGTLGLAVVDSQGLTLLPRVTTGIAEELNTGIYIATVQLYPGWSGDFLWDALPGYVSFPNSFNMPDEAGLAQALATANGVETTTGGQYGNGTLTFTQPGTGAVVAAFDLKREPTTQNIIQRTRTA